MPDHQPLQIAALLDQQREAIIKREIVSRLSNELAGLLTEQMRRRLEGLFAQPPKRPTGFRRGRRPRM